MIVTVKQLAKIRAGKTTAFVPQSYAARWRVGQRISLRRLVVDGSMPGVENYRKSVPIIVLSGEDEGVQFAVTLVAIGDAMPLGDVSQAAAQRAGFHTMRHLVANQRELYSRSKQRENVVPIVFSLADDRPKLLTAKAHTLSTSDYTSSPRKAMRGEPEAIGLRAPKHLRRRTVDSVEFA